MSRRLRCKHDWGEYKQVVLGGYDWFDDGIHYIVGRRTIEVRWCKRCGEQHQRGLPTPTHMRWIFWGLAFVVVLWFAGMALWIGAST